MESHRKIAIIVGTLFIIATTAPILSFQFLQHMTGPDYLINISEHTTQMSTGALLELIMAVAIAGIAITIYPILKQYDETFAIGYICVRLMEALIFIVVAVLGVLLMLTLSREFTNVGSPDFPSFETLGTLLREAHDWGYVISGKIVFSLSALILNYVLYQINLVPRFIAGWGLLGATLLLVGGLSNLYGALSDTSVLGTLMFLPIALQEMVFAVWLIVKGFNLSEST